MEWTRDKVLTEVREAMRDAQMMRLPDGLDADEQLPDEVCCQLVG